MRDRFEKEWLNSKYMSYPCVHSLVQAPKTLNPTFYPIKEKI